jgi:hypothetical protein
MADANFNIPDMPTPARCKDFFIAYQIPEYTLSILLESNPKHRMAFEYLMSYYLLQKDIEQVKWCMDNFYEYFDYQDIPLHYEEALVIYPNIVRADSEFFRRYPVSKTTRDRFGSFMQAYNAARNSNSGFEKLEKQFGNTYWYYVYFVESTKLQKTDEENRY